MRTFLLILTLHLLVGANFIEATAQVKPLRAQASIVNDLLADRYNNLLPSLMDRAQMDC